MLYNLIEIASCFKTASQVSEVKPLGEGFINDTFIVSTVSSVRYILQRKNKSIFTDIPAMMENIHKVTEFLKHKVVRVGGDPMREVLTLTPAKDGRLYHKTLDGEYWAMCLFVENTITYTSAATPELAYQGGKGIGMFQCMLSDFSDTLTNILPGFHDIKFRFNQWDKAISDDLVGRVSSLQQEIEWIESRRAEMLSFWSLVETGVIPRRVTHNDTKINNILFDRNGDVLCVIDLDTVLSSTVLNDFGDAIRSYTNTGLEDDTDLSRVSMSIDMFRAYTQGYLSQTHSFMNDAERSYLAFSAKYITYEQVLRFLMDYINGDTYYKISSPLHNLERTHAQYKLLQSIESQMDNMNSIVREELKNVQ